MTSYTNKGVHNERHGKNQSITSGHILPIDDISAIETEHERYAAVISTRIGLPMNYPL
jgi:hypothetical protein